MLYDIINCEQDITSHCLVEDRLFIPAVKRLEEDLRAKGSSENTENCEDDSCDNNRLEALSQREIEIISCVARGLTNKEIANELCLSVHTITTHRRNIANKLQIHTPNGLTIYAIVNHLVELNDIKIE